MTLPSHVKKIHSLPIPRNPGRVARWLWFSLACILVVDLFWASIAQISVSNVALVSLGIGMFFLIWAAYSVTARNSRIADMGQYAAAWIVFGTVGTIFSYCTATLGQPLYDMKFEAWDAMLGFHWKTWWDAVLAHPLLIFIFAVCYSSFPVQICVAIIYFSHKQVPDRNRELLWIAILSGVIVSLISGLLPASGAFEYFGVPEFASHLSVLTALRESGAHSFQLGKTEGIVTFPCYHTNMALPGSFPPVLPMTILASRNSLRTCRTCRHFGNPAPMYSNSQKYKVLLHFHLSIQLWR